MNINFDELSDWKHRARSRLERELEHVQERGMEIGYDLKALDVIDQLQSGIEELREELDRKQEEIDDMEEQLEQKDKVIDDLQRQLQDETGDLRQQLLEVKNQHLASEKQHLEAEANTKSLEIHNHFEPGSNSQVFNDKVNGKFTRKQNVKKDKKDKKKRWKKIVRKVL